MAAKLGVFAVLLCAAAGHVQAFIHPTTPFHRLPRFAGEAAMVNDEEGGTRFDFSTMPDRKNTGALKWDKYKGRDIIPLWVADMDLPTCPAVLEGLQSYIAKGDAVFGYTLPTSEAYAAVRSYMEERHGAQVQDRWTLFSPGVVQSLNLCCKVVPENSGIIVFTPIYSPFLSAPAQTQRNLIQVGLKLGQVDGNERWTFDFDALEMAVEGRKDKVQQDEEGELKPVSMLLLCNPHNPVGRVFTEGELSRLGKWCESHDITIVSDEIHSDLVLEPEAEGRHVPMLAVDGGRFQDRTILLNAPSKTFNTAGLCCSFLVIPNHAIRRKFLRAASGIITQNPALGYVGLVAAFTQGWEWQAALLTHLRGNRDAVYAFVEERLPELRMRPMQATYLAWLDVTALGWRDPVLTFERHGVGLTDGRFFAGEQHVRINFGCPRDVLMEGLRRMEAAVVAEHRQPKAAAAE